MDNPAVCRMEPRRSSTFKNKIEGHQMRRRPESHIDSTRTCHNRILVGSENIEQDMLDKVEQYGKVDKRTIDGAEYVLTAHVDYFDEISPKWREGKISKKLQEWIDLNVEFMKNEHGDGLVSMVLHLDETAPHIHANVVPIATYEKKFRRGSKTQTKVHYSHHFNDPKWLIKQARDEKNPELTKLGRLQSRYALKMEPVGLVRGVAGSERRHQETRRYGKEIAKQMDRPEQPEKLPVPDATLITAMCDALGITTERDKVLSMNKAARQEWMKERGKYIRNIESKAKAHDRMQSETKSLKKSHSKKDEQMKKLRNGLELSKAEIDALRSTDLSKVADKLMYDGSMTNEKGKPRWKGAIDMTMEVAGLDYEGAVIWLHEELGTDFTKSALTEDAIRKAEKKARKLEVQSAFGKVEKPLTKQQYAIVAELGKQLDGLGADAYRITLMHETLPTYNHGKGKGPDGTERFYSRNDVLKLVPELNYKNGRDGYNIFITPIDEMSQYILIDDMTHDTLSEVKAKGITPCITQYSSEGNIQAVVRVACKDELQAAANEWFKDMNRQYGDVNIQGLRHPFRAVGFRNVKPKHMQPDGRYPVVSIIQAAAQSCQTALQAIVSKARDIAQGKSAARPVEEQKKLYEALIRPDLDVDALPDLERIAVKHYQVLAGRYGSEIDMSRADWMLAEKLIGMGHEAYEIASVMMKHSPNIEHRKSNLLAYIDRTIGKAVDEDSKKLRK